MRLCKCGCNKEVSKSTNIFINGHNKPTLGRKYPKSVREHMGRQKGFISWNRGLTKYTDERVKKSSEKSRKTKMTDKYKKFFNDVIVPKVYTEQTRLKQSISRKKIINSNPEYYLNILKQTGIKNKGKQALDKHHNWQGGKSFEEYTINWTKSLKQNIRERDKYMCKICGILQNDTILHVHHIDYDKKNCSPNNLITLCKKCHMKTNHKREEWIDFFKNIKI